MCLDYDTCNVQERTRFQNAPRHRHILLPDWILCEQSFSRFFFLAVVFTFLLSFVRTQHWPCTFFSLVFFCYSVIDFSMWFVFESQSDNYRCIFAWRRHAISILSIFFLFFYSLIRFLNSKNVSLSLSVHFAIHFSALRCIKCVNIGQFTFNLWWHMENWCTRFCRCSHSHSTDFDFGFLFQSVSVYLCAMIDARRARTHVDLIFWG